MKITEELTLDVGCGEHKRGAIGADVKRFAEIDVLADACYLPFQSNCFVGCFLYHVLEHVKDPIQVLRETKRVLKKDGWLRISVPTDSRLRTDVIANLSGFDFKALIQQYRFLKSGGHKWQYSRESLIHLLEKQGFSVNRVEYPAMPIAYGRKGKILFKLKIRRHRNLRVYASKRN